MRVSVITFAAACASVALAEAPFPGEINLAALRPDDGFVIRGAGAGDRTGVAVSFLGDVNADGVDDLVIGAPYADPDGKPQAGKSYVLFGGAGLGAGGAIELVALDGSDGFVILGIDKGDKSGWSVAAAGDVNADGVGDIIIGAHAANPPGLYEGGESYVLFGGKSVGADGAIELASLDGSNGFVVHGVDPMGRSGCSVSSAGDVNADGVGDIIIGARRAKAGGSESGRAYVVLGRAGIGAGGAFDLASLDGSNGYVLDGIDPFDTSGASVASAGDVNADGVDDLVIGAPYAGPNEKDRAGESYVLFGGAGVGADGAIDLDSLNGKDGFVISGAAAGDKSGSVVARAGDVNDDGAEDLLVGAYDADPNGKSNAGASYVLFGGAGVGAGGGVDLATLGGEAGFVIQGVAADDLSGFALSSAGDVNADGVADIVIGARWAGAHGRQSGRSYVLYGGNGVGVEGALTLESLDGETGFVINGADEQDLSGYWVSGAGDVNGDGVTDLVIGAPLADPNGKPDAGECYVLFGR